MPISHILLAIFVAAIWGGGNFMFAELGVHKIPPLFLCATRYAAALVISGLCVNLFVPRLLSLRNAKIEGAFEE